MKKIDPRLNKTLKTFSASFRVKRENAFEGLDFEALRDRLAAVKDSALARNEKLLAAFEEKAGKHGSRVIRAADGDEANRAILDILKKHGVKLLAKGKSMVSEETRLNEFLSKNGVEPRETDLGEWIIQLAGESPTHMVMPAIHMMRGEVAGIFSRYLEKDVPEDIPALVRIAREELRKDIFRAGAGLTGANALVAENGSIMLVTNEGNGRLVTTVPPVHIVLASTEKVLETTEEALLQLRLLTRNATGQTISSYVSFIAGPHAADQYIVLLDNHRSDLLADEEFRSTLRCIKCSACLNVCPVYELIGGKEFSHIYMGGIGSLLTAWIHGLKASKEPAGFCLGCHRCEEVCSTKIPIAGLVRSLKERLNAGLGKPLWKRIAFDGVMSRPAVHQGAFRIGRGARRLVGRKDGFARRLPLWMRKYDRFRALPAPAAKPFSKRFAESRPFESAGPPKGLVKIFPGCLVEHFYPQVGLAAARVLSRLGYRVELGPSGCCGFPPANSGFSAAAKKAYMSVLGGLQGADFVVTLCPTCTTMLAETGPGLLNSEEARKTGAKVLTFSRFLALYEEKALSGLLHPGGAEGDITYHDSCHHKYVLKASEDSRRLLRVATGRDVIEMDKSASCCGFAGAFSVDHPEISGALAAEKIAAIERTGARVVALDCPGCLLQIRGGCRRAGSPAEAKHTAEIIDALLH